MAVPSPAASSSAAPALSVVWLTVALLAQLPRISQGGYCWSSQKDGRCSGMLKSMVSKEQCCASGSPSTGWSAEELDSSRLFFLLALGGGVPNCFPCKESCTGVECPAGKHCVLRKSSPKCVCAPDCSKAKRKGPVCGTDGHTYRNYCTLLKRSCRKKKPVQTAYYGPCQKVDDVVVVKGQPNGPRVEVPYALWPVSKRTSEKFNSFAKSCDALKCPGKKQCLLDQNLTPHCVRCSRPCPDSKAKNFVCGVDGVTYNSFCHLRQAACQKGRAIPVAYQGKCKVGATCDKVRCAKGKTCLAEAVTGKPRCTTCHYNCRTLKLQMDGPVCATNNQTYPSWCHMMQAACDMSIVLETRSSGKCDEDNSTHEPNSIPLLDHESSTKS